MLPSEHPSLFIYGKEPKSWVLDKEFSNTLWHMVSVRARVGGGDGGSMD